jgi:ParB family chromosome partitioning protein
LGADHLLSEAVSIPSPHANFIDLPLDHLTPGQFQPRRVFKETELNELSDSIKEQGVLQPLIVRKIETNYEIIAGERRWRAARIAGLTKVPVIVREVDDATALAVALIENLQRQDLNPLEEAEALERLVTEFSITHDEVAKRVGRTRSAVSNLLRLLALEETTKLYVHKGELTMGHARALLALPVEQQPILAKDIIKNQLSVRQTEQFINKLQKKVISPHDNTITELYDNLIDEIEQVLLKKTNGDVTLKINQTNGKCKLTMEFNSVNHLKQGLAELLVGD